MILDGNRIVPHRARFGKGSSGSLVIRLRAIGYGRKYYVPTAGGAAELVRSERAWHELTATVTVTVTVTVTRTLARTTSRLVPDDGPSLPTAEEPR